MFALALTAVGAVVALTQPWLTKTLIDKVSNEGRIGGLIVALAGLFVVGAVIDALSQYLLERVSENVARDLRKSIGKRILSAPLKALSRFRSGDLLARATSDTTVVRQMLSTSLVQLFSVAIYGVGTLILMLSLDKTLLLVMVVTIVVAALLVVTVLAGIRVATERAQGAVGQYAADLERILGSIRTVKAFSAEEDERTRLDASTDEAYNGGLRAARLGALVSPAIELAVNGALLIVLLLGGIRVAKGEMDIGDLVAFLLYATYLVMPLAGLFGALATLQQGLAGLQRIEDTKMLGSERRRDYEDRGAANYNLHAPTSIEFKGVTASYDDERNAIDNVTFSLQGPGIAAIVGPSGAGKSTIINLLEQFMTPSSGRILVNGASILDLDPFDHRRMLTLVDQDSPLLDGTLRENLLYGRIASELAAGDERLVEALVQSGLGQFISELPNGLDSRVGERGHALSGGERQRVALARALLTPSPIYLFDEPSSSLDVENERLVAEAIRRLAKAHLVLVITHRAALIQSADSIVVLEGGKVAGSGPIEQLSDNDTLVRAMKGAS
ncbi:ABC transporter ATP-binding protein [Leucobacter insecticola]|uniref:ABC transporter ATP-binding protein n=1 Tax=Leucobacter insecticola TaxID=2714934 RepID=A0A6G8FI47_9MICO|nr:ABC transporter ATP-binding protein [Leucobacter insecticola]QIM16021.1 ABC transporter ATP-binding protein [Leucobacter insecticola]